MHYVTCHSFSLNRWIRALTLWLRHDRDFVQTKIKRKCEVSALDNCVPSPHVCVFVRSSADWYGPSPVYKSLSLISLCSGTDIETIDLSLYLSSGSNQSPVHPLHLLHAGITHISHRLLITHIQNPSLQPSVMMHTSEQKPQRDLDSMHACVVRIWRRVCVCVYWFTWCRD